MKKKLEADLISIAHRILKLKNKSEVIQLHAETQKLYEKLSVLKFLEENFSELKPTIGQQEVEAALESIQEEKAEVIKNEPVVAEKKAKEKKGEIVEETQKTTAPQETAVLEEVILETKKEETPLFEPVQEATFDKKEENSEPKSKPSQPTFEELLGQVTALPVFEKAEDVVKSAKSQSDYIDHSKAHAVAGKIISIGLNDRIGFEKQLFNGSGEDLNRVLSQLNTHTNLQEAKDFIDQFVKPDYNNWEGKEEYETRFLEIIENKFK